MDSPWLCPDTDFACSWPAAVNNLLGCLLGSLSLPQSQCCSVRYASWSMLSQLPCSRDSTINRSRECMSLSKPTAFSLCSFPASTSSASFPCWLLWWVSATLPLPSALQVMLVRCISHERYPLTDACWRLSEGSSYFLKSFLSVENCQSYLLNALSVIHLHEDRAAFKLRAIPSLKYRETAGCSL